MRRPAGFLLDRERAPIERLRLGIVALMFPDMGQAFQCSRDERMVRTKRLGPVVDDRREQSLGLVVTALAVVNDRKLALYFGNVWVVWAEQLLHDSERVHGSGFGVSWPVLKLVNLRQIVEDNRDLGRTGPKRRLSDVERSLEHPLCIIQPTLPQIDNRQVIECRG